MPLQLNEHLRLNPYFVDTSATPGFNWERFQDKIDVISDNLFALLVDEATSEFIKSLTQKYIRLSPQGPDVARLIRDVVIADVFIGDMPQELSRRLGIDQQLAREVANQIVSQLFTPVLEDLKKLHREKFPGRLPAKPATQQVPGDRFQVSGQSGQAQPQKYQGEELPESGGNIIDLRNKP